MWRSLTVVLLLAGLQGCGSVISGEESAPAAEVSLRVEGMMCAESCAKTVEEILASRPGALAVTVDFETQRATCEVDPATFDAAAAIAELADQDFVATVAQ